MPQIPEPNYEYDVKELVRLYQTAIDDILRELQSMDLSDMTRANQLGTLKVIQKILAELNGEAGSLAQKAIEKAVTDGVVRAIVSLDEVTTVAEAEKIVSFNRINKSLVEAVVADTQADLLAVTQNVEKKVRATVRQVSAEVLRANVTKGVNATATLRRDIVAELRKQLGESVNTGIIDNVGRRWKPTTYVDMLVRTKMMYAHKESTINEALGRGVLYGVISKHGAKDACKDYEGKVVKLSRDADGDYPFIGDLPRNKIFHPTCKHLVTPIRKPERA